MNPELYQRAKTLFQLLADAPAEDRRAKLEQLQHVDPALAQEVRSLLDYHTTQSLVIPPSGQPKIRTRSTLSTTYQVRSNHWLPAILTVASLVAALLVGVGLLTTLADQRVHRELKRTVAQQMTTTVDSRLRDFKQWESTALSQATTWSQDPTIVAEIQSLIAGLPEDDLRSTDVSPQLRANPCEARLGDRLMQLAGVPVRFAIWDRRMVKLLECAADKPPASDLGAFASAGEAAMLAPVLKGSAKLLMKDPAREDRTPQNDEIAVLAPVLDGEGRVMAAWMLWGYGLHSDYREMLWHWGQDAMGETYLINSRGYLCSPSRYRDQLLDLPLSRSADRTDFIQVRDPGVNLLTDPPAVPASSWPPTLLAREVTAGNDGLSVDSYRNYVGEQVVGAWRWLPEYQLGIAVETNHAEAYGVADMVRWPLLLISGLLSSIIVGMSVNSTLANFRKRKLRDISEVGPYQILEVLGEGGMGRVYLAEHALLCRQSAIKVLTKGDNDLSVISRFEREVQLASQLTHPNTIAIYDFGRNKDGIFYYAMEYIDGAHLGQLVEYCGALEPGRCVFLLQQLCRALAEAHQAGVVHRDIKPQNIMVCNRGGEPDFIKLFDYGLVKSFAPGISETTHQTKVVVGTPRFMAPERLDSPWLADPRVDVYSVGALAYFLLTGKLPPLVVSGGSNLNVEQPGIETLDLPPAVVAFGGLLSNCLSVEPAARPSNMQSLLRELDALAEKFPWSRNDSLQWWHKHRDKLLHQVHKQRAKLASHGTIKEL